MMELQHWQHWQHPLVFNEDERSERLCWGCCEPVFGPSYSCIESDCDGYYDHHKSCAELPLGLHHPSHPNHPLILIDIYKYVDNEEEYNKFSKCDVCGERSNEYSYCCYRCNFNIHIKCSSLSPTIQTEVHDHQLTRSIWKLMKFTCDFCGKEGNLPYLCAQCDFAIHSRCAACPRILKVYRHNHPLHLTPSLEVHQSDSPICLLCVRKVDTLCLYYCSRCDFVAHLYCAMLHWNREYINLQELKEEQSTESKSEDSELHQSFDSKICKVKKTTVGEDGTEIAIEIKHFSHEHDLKLTDEILNNTKCNGCTLNVLHYHKPHGTTNMNISSTSVILLKMTLVNITVISVKKNEIPSNGSTTVQSATFLLIVIVFLGKIQMSSNTYNSRQLGGKDWSKERVRSCSTNLRREIADISQETTEIREMF
ncbi:hypothetical protein CMV_030223 [Castanea mollissima]|uniref:DC1 domain-containing protein n=1 Tax=Castanea mollissima TaxID=60419 RepID=A0A8J4Q8P8_9ROSI|nr:hypothetical protein CMV_030223 [Castanea mollissima]